MDALAPLTQFFGTDKGFALLRALALLVGGWVLARAAAGLTTRLLRNLLDNQRLFLLRRSAFYAIFALALFSALLELGFNLGVLLGAAGLLTVALGFAAQTSASNVISGLFLIGESPFSIGDTIVVEGITGEVLSIDLLSVKLRTMDNLFVRVPNESLIKSRVTTLTRFPIRRYDLQLHLAHGHNLAHAFDVLEAATRANPLCLEEPPPLLIFQGFGEAGAQIQVSVWAARENFLAMRNALAVELQAALVGAGIEFGVPHRRWLSAAASDEAARTYTGSE